MRTKRDTARANELLGDLPGLEWHPVAPLFFAAIFVKDRFHEFMVTQAGNSTVNKIDQSPPVAFLRVIGGEPKPGKSFAFDNAIFVGRGLNEFFLVESIPMTRLMLIGN